MTEPVLRRATLSHPPVFSLSETDGPRIAFTSDTGAMAYLFVLEQDVMRVLLLANGKLTSSPSWAIAPGAEDIAEPGRDRMSAEGFACPRFSIEESDREIRISTEKLRVTIQRLGFHCKWEQSSPLGWQQTAQDRPTQAYNFGWWDEATYHYVTRLPGERFYGLGERSGPMDRANQRWRLTNLDPMGYDAELTDPLYKAISYLLVVDADGAGYGVFYDTTHDPVFDLGREHDNYHPHYRYVRAESGDLDYYMIAGPDPMQVTRRFTWLTGRPALMPRWAVEYSGSTMSYTDAPDAQERMNDFIAGLQQHDIGCGSFHLSSGYTSIGDKRYVFNWNRDKFPDPSGFVAHFAQNGIELVPNIKPALLVSHPRYGDLATRGWFITDQGGAPIECQFWDEVGSYVDFTNPAAAAWWRDQVIEQLLTHGIRATWNDNNEFEIWDSRARIDGFGAPRAAASERPVQTLLMMRASRAAQVAFRPDERPYVVTRSGMAGMQRYAQTWSGDNFTAWKTLRFNQKMALGMALSGVSNTGHDVGGFAGPAPEPELLLRWVQAGVVMPRFSIHSWNTDGTVNEPWMYSEATPAIVGMMALRQALVPLLHDLLWRHHANYEPLARPLWLDYPADARCWEDGDSYLLGPDLLVAPAFDPGVDALEVYLPGGETWHDLRTGERYEGGRAHKLPAPLEGLPPLLAREGSVHLIELGRRGFGNRARRPGVMVFPGRGCGRFTASLFDEDAARWTDLANPPLWRISVETSDSAIAITVGWSGAPQPPESSLTLALPVLEERAITVNGAVPTCRSEAVLGCERKVFSVEV